MSKLPGLPPPPVNADAATRQWMEAYAEAVGILAGQRGNPLDQAVTFRQMLDSGLAVQSKYSSSSNLSFEPVGDSGFSLDDLLTVPDAPINVRVRASQTGLHVTWDVSYQPFVSNAEVYRSGPFDTDEVADPGVLLGVSNSYGFSDDDIVPGKYYRYWVRFVSVSGARSPWHILSGTSIQIPADYTSDFEQIAGKLAAMHFSDSLASAYTMTTTTLSDGRVVVTGMGVLSGSDEDGVPYTALGFQADNFFFAAPDSNIKPFSVVNMGSPESPSYKAVLQADVIINGTLSVTNLTSGELRPGVDLTIGNQSIIMSTASDGYGELVLTGQGGIGQNDYTVLGRGEISSFVYDHDQHWPYKEVKRVERGVCQSGDVVTIPSYFKGTPTIYLTPSVVPTYNKDYPSQSQQWRLTHNQPTRHPSVPGSWVFTPLAQLELSDGNSTAVYPDRAYNGASNTHEVILLNRTSLKSCRFNARFNSVRQTAENGFYYNRSVTVQVFYRNSGSSSWTLGSTSTISQNQFSDTGAIIDFVPPVVGNYDLRLLFIAQDRGGTFTSGAQQYEYYSETQNIDDFSLYETTRFSSSVDLPSSKTVKSSLPKPGAHWELYQQTWSYDYDIPNWLSSDNPRVLVSGYLGVPLGSSQVVSNDNSTLPLQGSFSFPVSSHDSTGISFSVSVRDISSGTPGATYSAYLNISNFTVQHDFRRYKASSGTAPDNRFWLDSVEFNQGAQVLSPSQGTLISWLAVES